MNAQRDRRTSLPRDYFSRPAGRASSRRSRRSTAQPFRRDDWTRPEGGGGIVALDRGRRRARARRRQFLARHGRRAAAVGDRASRRELAGRAWEAMGVSLVLHPRNPYAPTVHMNVRMFVAHAPARRRRTIWWFGGGMDLTPYYGFDEDAVHFHRTLPRRAGAVRRRRPSALQALVRRVLLSSSTAASRAASAASSSTISNEGGFDRCFALTRSVGDHFLAAYVPILERRKDTPYGERERDFQAYRRGRYVEFNLVWDRGTLFGLQSNGRTEAILMSLPPVVKWRYDWKPAAGHAGGAALHRFSRGEGLARWTSESRRPRDDAHLIETQRCRRKPCSTARCCTCAATPCACPTAARRRANTSCIPARC